MGLLGKWVESLDYEYEISTSCTRHRSPHSSCEKCIAVCEEKAITLVNNKPVIERDKCSECGNCISACSTQSISGIYPKRTVINNQLLITREHTPTVKELLVLRKKGVKVIVSEEPSLNGAWKHVVEETNSMLDQLGEEPFTISNKAIEKAEESYSRRELFSLWKKSSQSLMVQATPAKWRFTHSDLDLEKYYPDYQFTSIAVDPNTCTLCKACNILCAKKCLTISETSFIVATQSCSSCQLCADICPEKAITIKELISAVNDIHYPIHKKQCSVCNQPYNTLREDDEKCVMCSTKREGYLSSN
ncbi:polyferredoxin [Neobacillus sp. FSL H8-0543]|uniref:polyferredoxin n=1 Tax=Neobacillus sp. FSL H8-0543 TaxID=2954672 RepID=UPI003158D3FC